MANGFALSEVIVPSLHCYFRDISAIFTIHDCIYVNLSLSLSLSHHSQPGSNAILLLEREVEVLKRVNHPYIIQLEEVFETSKVSRHFSPPLHKIITNTL